MSRFLSKKKSKAAVVSPVEEAPPPVLPELPQPQEEKKRWRRKKQAPEVEPMLDVGAALPSTDNFRTSLLMPNLSARFSMLREQDDPFSLIGKANDDSVLAPRRRSRLADFGPGGGLSDIDEVSSIAEPVRPLFATSGRLPSYASEPAYLPDDDASQHGGSIMNRARPGEGNILFGGRQKIYKIPIGDAGAVRAPGSGEARGMRGRALYEDDVSLSSFQKYREKEREREREREAERQRSATDGQQAFDLDLIGGEAFRSPSLSLSDDKRATSSSTNSGPYSVMSASTAPTSIHSHGTHPAISPGLPSGTSSPSQAPMHVERQRSKRLYEPGLNQHLQEQQSAAMDRIYSSKRTPESNENSTSPAKATAKTSAQASLNSSRTASPVPPASEKLTTFDSVRDRKGSESNKFKMGPSNPRQLASMNDGPDKENVLTQAMRASDRGKATAMGQFSRPKAYDDQQYFQRQISLQRQRQNSSDNERPRFGDSPLKSFRPSPLDIGRARAETNRSDRSWSASSGTRNGSSAISAVSHSSQKEQRLPSPGPGHARKSSEIDATGTFFSAGVDDDAESDADEIKETTLTVSRDRNAAEPSPGMPSPGISAPLHRVPPPMFKHPAMRASPSLPDIRSSAELSPKEKKDRRNAWNPDAALPDIPKTPLAETSEETTFEFGKPSTEVNDTEQSGANESSGLSGLVREHLRQPSNQSSIYPPNTPGLSVNDDAPGFELRVPSEYSQISNPWEGEDWNKNFQTDSTPNVVPETENKAPISTNTPTPLFSSDDAQLVRETSLEADQDRDARGRHMRGPSSETQHERVALKNELAERQKTIQENLKVKKQSRSPSPHLPPASKYVFDNSLKPFGKLNKRPSLDSMSKQESSAGATRSKRVFSPTFDRNARGEGRKASIRDDSKSPAPVGRTLHSRMPQQQQQQQQEEDPPASRGQLSVSGSQETQQSPPESSRTSTSRDTTTPSEVSSDRFQRLPLKDRSDSVTDTIGGPSYEQTSLAGSPSQGSLEITRSPTMDTTVPVPGRFRKDSNGSTCTTFPRYPVEPPPGRNFRKASDSSEPLPTPLRPTLTTTNSQPLPISPLAKSASTHSSPLASSADHASFLSRSSPNLHIPTNTSLAQTPLANQAPQILKSAEAHYHSNMPAAAFNFPQRAPAQRPQRHRKGTINKSEISDPTLISSTSTADTVSLPEGASLRNDGTFDAVLGPNYGGSPTSPLSGSVSPTYENKDSRESQRKTFKQTFGSLRDKQGPSNARKSEASSSSHASSKMSPTPLYTHFPAAHSRRPSGPGMADARFIRQLDGKADLAGDEIPRDDSHVRDGVVTVQDTNEHIADDDDDGDDGYKPIAPSSGRLHVRKIGSNDSFGHGDDSMNKMRPEQQMEGGMF